MDNRALRLQSENYLNPYRTAVIGEKKAKKMDKKAISKYRRTLENRQVKKEIE